MTAGSMASRVVALMPAWNAARFIGPVLEAWSAQTHPGLTLLISVDRSDDDTAERCERFADGRPHVQVLRQRRRLGWTGNVNALLARADGDLACLAPHDDTPQPAFVARMVEALAQTPEAVLAYPDVETPGGTLALPDPAGDDPQRARLRQLLRRETHWYVPYRGVFRIAAARRLRRMRVHLAGEYMADWPWLVRLAMLGPFVRVPQALVHKSLHGASLSRSWGGGIVPDAAVIAACLAEIVRGDLPWRWKASLVREVIAHDGPPLWARVQRQVVGARRS